MRAVAFQSVLKSLDLDESGCLSRTQYFALLDSLDERIAQLEEWLKGKAAVDKKAKLLQTQRGVGYLTALATVHTLGDVSRFTRTAKQVTSFSGLDPLEHSSAGRTRFGSVSKAGSPMLRFQLGQAASIAARFDPKLKSFYKRLAKKKPKRVAKTAAARKLLVKLAIMLRDEITAEEFDKRGRTVGNARAVSGSAMTAP